MRATSFLVICAALVVAVARPAFAGQQGPAASTVEAAAPAAAPSGTPAADSLTRAAVLAAAREQKALELKPVERSTVEKGLYWYDNQYLLPTTGYYTRGGDTKSNHGEHLGLQHEPCSENGEYLS